MKKLFTWLLCIILLLSLTPSAAAEEGGSFVLTAVTANAVIVEPEPIPYTSGQTIKEALLASGHRFTGLEQGFIYEVDGAAANFQLFYDKNGYDLTAPAESITALCIGVSSQYSENLLELIRQMAAYRQMGNVCNYPDAQSAYKSGLTAIRNGDADKAQAALDGLNAAIAAYNAVLNGTKYTVSVSAAQGDHQLPAPTVTLTDIYGNKTTVTGTSLEVVAGEYRFCVCDGGFNRTEGTLTVSKNVSLSVTLPSGEWFGDTKILDSSKEPYPYVQNTETHTAVFRIPDVAKELSSLYLNIGLGDVPDKETTRLRTIYTGTNGIDYSGNTRSWESTFTALTYLVEPGMTDASFALEAQYTDSRGHTQIQSYDMTLERVPTLASLTVTADATVLPLTFDPRTVRYDLITVSDRVEIAAQGFGADYVITGTGSTAVSDTHTVTVSSGGRKTEYTLNFTKKDSIPVNLTVPDGVIVQISNAAGSVVAPVDGVYRLIPGERYSYLSTKDGHYHTTAGFTAEENMTVSVAEPVAANWLEDLAMYNGSNAANRKLYTCQPAFSPATHSYSFAVSDCNTTAYIQATSEYTVTAFYRTQTASASTHNIAKTVKVSQPVGTDSAANILGQAVARSGFSNAVTLRLSKDQDGVTYYQDYHLTLARSLHLTKLSLRAQQEVLPLLRSDGTTCTFDRDNTAYTVKVNREETSLTLSGAFPNTSDATSCCGGYSALIGGVKYEDLDAVELSLNPERDKETISIQVCHTDRHSQPRTYTITVEKTDPAPVTIATTPADAIVYLTNDQSGKRVLPEDGVYQLTPGNTYSYTVTCKGYIGISGSYTAPEQAATLTLALEKAPQNSSLQNLSSYWPHLRQNSDNNGIIGAPAPIKDEETALYWATQIGSGFDSNACGCPILVDGCLYTYAGTTIYKVDTISGKILATGTMDHASSFAINPPTYADGMLFVGLADGTVQAFNAATLESLWIYRDPLGGQPNCSITYHNGYLYTGFWVGETSKANFVCLTATDEDPTNPKESKLATWHYTSQGGFYWAGAYVCNQYLLVGTDDGSAGYTTGHGSLLSFDPKTGTLLDSRKMSVVGDIRSSITHYNGKYYFTNKGGYFFEATVAQDGTIQSVKPLKLYNYASDPNAPAMSTCTPTIYNGRAYIGVSGTSQFGAYSGHNITVIDIPNWEIAYTVRTQGYPQTSGVLTTAYQKDSGSVYVYFFDNFTPGKLRVLEDKPGQTSASLVTVENYSDKGTTKAYETAYTLFTPSGDQAQYAICSPIMDAYGTIYFKNDSAYLMAVGSTVTQLEIVQQPQKLEYQAGEFFDGSGLQVVAHYANGKSRDVTKYVTWSEDALTTEDTDFLITLPYMMYQNKEGQAGVECEKPFVSLTLTIHGSTPGDVDGNGNLNMEDVSLLLRALNSQAALTPEQMAAADINGDGDLNMEDVSLLLQTLNATVSQSLSPTP